MTTRNKRIIKNSIIVSNLVLLTLYFAWSVMQKENVLKNGQLVLLELAPKDPRSLMQGDYMSLQYSIGADRYKGIPETGYFVLHLDHNGVGTIDRFQMEASAVADGELLLKYDAWGRKTGAEVYFFQEGDAQKYGKAKYGGLKIDKHGNSILTGLFDEEFRLIKPDGTEKNNREIK
jgi:uncharacterized membrane-anchored protein